MKATILTVTTIACTLLGGTIHKANAEVKMVSYEHRSTDVVMMEVDPKEEIQDATQSQVCKSFFGCW